MSKMTRRTFLAGSTVIFVGGCATPGAGNAKPRKTSANDKLNIAGVGAGGKGNTDVRAVSGQNNIVCLCDVDDKRAAETYTLFPNAKKYKDFRVMLEKEHKNIDAVTISTPDHMHAPIAMACMEMGKHVFVQKPLTHDIFEARRLMETARQYKVATHMGNQGHAGEGVRRVTEWMEAGVIGQVHTVYCWTNRPVWPQPVAKPTETQPIPETLDWDLWVGTAEMRPYNQCYLPHNWRGFWDFGCGALGDMGCHIMDPAYTSLKLGLPISVEAEQEGNTDYSGPKWSMITYEFPGRGSMPPVKLIWCDGGKEPPFPESVPMEERAKLGDSDKCGTLFIGDKGMVTCDTYGDSPRLVPYAKPNVPKRLPTSPGHYVEWIEACKGGEPAKGNFDYAGPFTEMVLLGNVAIRAGQKVDWDSEAMKVTNVLEANKYIKREYRKGYKS